MEPAPTAPRLTDTDALPVFTTPRDRDARATFRGFVYQVDVTIDRWLKLTPDQELELERGEDIDVITRWFNSDGDEGERGRTLEQLKALSGSITLRSAVSLESA